MISEIILLWEEFELTERTRLWSVDLVFGRVAGGQFFTLLGPFWTLAGSKIFSKHDQIKLSP